MDKITTKLFCQVFQKKIHCKIIIIKRNSNTLPFISFFERWFRKFYKIQSSRKFHENLKALNNTRQFKFFKIIHHKKRNSSAVCECRVEFFMCAELKGSWLFQCVGQKKYLPSSSRLSTFQISRGNVYFTKPLYTFHKHQC